MLNVLLASSSLHVKEKHEPFPVNLVFPRSCCSGRTPAAPTAAEIAHPCLQTATRGYAAVGVATISPGRVTQEDRQRLGSLLAGDKEGVIGFGSTKFRLPPKLVALAPP